MIESRKKRPEQIVAEERMLEILMDHPAGKSRASLIREVAHVIQVTYAKASWAEAAYWRLLTEKKVSTDGNEQVRISDDILHDRESRLVTKLSKGSLAA